MPAAEPIMPGKGQRFEGTLTSDLSLLRGWSWPYVAISGKEDGPQTTIIAGVHGCEYVSIRAAVRLAREIDPAEVRGQILVLPIVNLPAYWERTAFVTPFDGKNPNRVFPGKATGTFSEAMAYFIFNMCIAPSEAFIDLHGGDIVEELVPFTGYLADAKPQVAERSRAMAEAFGLPYIIARGEQPGALSGMTYTAAARHGIPSVLAEAGGIGQLTLPDVDLLLEGARRALQAAGTLPGEPSPPRATHLNRSDWLYSKEAGFWISDVRAGNEVKGGQRLGQILSLLGEPVEAIEAPYDGVIIFRTTSAAVKQNGLLLAIGA